MKYLSLIFLMAGVLVVEGADGPLGTQNGTTINGPVTSGGGYVAQNAGTGTNVTIYTNLSVVNGNVGIGILNATNLLEVGDGVNGFVAFPLWNGVNFFISDTGPLYGKEKAGINYRSIVGESLTNALLHRADSYIWEGTNAVWQMSLDVGGLNIGSPNGSAPPNTLSRLEVNGNVSIGNGNARINAALPNGLLVQGHTQLGTLGDFGILNVGISGDNLSAFTLGDPTPSSAAGIYLRCNGSSPATISTAGAPLAFDISSPGNGEVMRLVNSGRVGIGTTTPTDGLTIYTASDFGLGVQATNSQIAYFYRGHATGVWGLNIGSDSSGPTLSTKDNATAIRIWPDNVHGVYVKNNGNVGIGNQTATAVLDVTGDIRASTTVTATNGFISMQSNKSAVTTITVGASPFSYTNTSGVNGYVIVDGSVAFSATWLDTTVQTSLAGGITIPLQNGEWTKVTYTVAPGMFFKPF